MKFKVGDKVKILPAARYSGVATKDIGIEGVISNAEHQDSLIIKMPPSATRDIWYISNDGIKLSTYKGQQLLLWDDIFEE